MDTKISAPTSPFPSFGGRKHEQNAKNRIFHFQNDKFWLYNCSDQQLAAAKLFV